MTVAIIAARSVLKDAEKRVSALEERLDSVELELKDLRAQAAFSRAAHSSPLGQLRQVAVPSLTVPVSVAKSPHDVNVVPSGHELTPDERTAAETRSRQKQKEAMESNFAGQMPDQSWSIGTATEVQAKVFARLPKDSRLMSIECRKSMCRLETSHHDEQTYQAFLSKSLAAPDFNWQGAIAYSTSRDDSSGEIAAVAYMMRAGYAPPYANEAD